jgi:hypothetical protein
MKRFYGVVLTMALAAGPAWANPTVSGVIEQAGNGILVIRNKQSGKVWRGRLVPNAKCTTNLTKGHEVAVRIKGAMNEVPLQFDMVTDWNNSEEIISRTAVAPYFTRMGDTVVNGGVAGKAPGAPDMGKQTNPGAFAVNGAAPHLNPMKVPNLTAPAAQDPGNANMQAGTPGFQSGPVNPGPTASPTNQGGPPQAPGLQPSQPGAPLGQDPYANPYANPAMNPYASNPAMNPYQNPAMMNPAMNPANTNLSMNSLLNGDNEENNGSAPGLGGPSIYANAGFGQGQPVTIQGMVLRSDPRTRTLMIQSMGSQSVQNVILGTQAVMPPVRDGQMVTITGVSTPQGFIEAQQVTPLAP